VTLINMEYWVLAQVGLELVLVLLLVYFLLRIRVNEQTAARISGRGEISRQ
jgi:hypothetical protein